jgi:hypothetical protein
MSESKTTQIGNRAGNDIVGRDKIVNQYSKKRSQITCLNERYLAERENDTEVYEIIKVLLHYSERETEDFRGLEGKLKDASREEDYIEYAKQQKELFAKRLIKRDLSPSAQKIFAYILGKVKTRFVHDVIPKIKSGCSEAEVEKSILVNVIEPIYEELEENVLDVSMDEMIGMLFFLTGNCHISWTKQC